MRNRCLAATLPLLRVAAALLFTSVAGVANAQSQPSVYSEQGKLIRAPQAVAKLGADLFGDKVNLYTGALEFVQTDVSLPGNSALPVSMGRRLVTGQEPIDGAHFGRWDLEIPHLHGIFAGLSGWSAGNGTDPSKRCSVFGKPRGVSVTGGSQSSWAANEFWHGNFMYIPGQGDQELLLRSGAYSQQPTGTAGNYPVVTRNNWSVRCLPAMDARNGAAGEAFLAIAPDGTEYRFDWLVSRPLTQLFKTNIAADPDSLVAKRGIPKPSPTPDSVQIPYLDRAEVWILPTALTDRFGNTVTYTYDSTNKWQLKTIVSNEAGGSPRTLTISYLTPGSTASNLISSVTDGTRTWHYSYDSTDLLRANLASVTQPDGSAWQLNGIAPLLDKINYAGEGSCDNPGNVDAYALVGAMTHPSGAHGKFTLQVTRHGRANVEFNCSDTAPGSAGHPIYPKNFDTLALISKVVSGAGLADLVWKTAYPPDASSWAPCNACAASKMVEVTDPAGDKTQHTFGTLFRETEGQLQKTDVLENGVALLRSTQLHYIEATAPYGSSDQRRGDGEMAARLMETDRRVTSQQGVDFTWQASGFNVFAQPSQVTRSSSLGMRRTETTTYDNNLAKWVLGQVASVSENDSGKVMVRNGYDAITANLETVSRFGHLEESMTYNADGTLATRKDGLNHVTTFTSYMRGLARNVRYADGNAESAVVNNIGLIDSTTDQTGFKTSYGYDSAGRLASITPPAADSVAWNPTTISTYRLATPDYAIDGPHWRQQVKTGHAITTNYFDALLRPLYTERWDDTDVAGTMRVTRHQYDFAGRSTFESYPQRSVGQIAGGVATAYDALGRVTGTSSDSELGKLTTVTAYHANFQKTTTDARNISTTTGYQAFDTPSDSAITHIIAPEGVVVDIDRDVFGKPRSITRAGGGKSATRSYVYDGFERLCKTVEPETGATVQGYDAANNVLWRASGLPSTTACDTAPAKRISFGYDALNRLTSTTFSDGSPAITRSYTADGLPDTASSNGFVWTNHYNKRRLNERESLAYGGATYNIDRAYDANGALRLLTYPDLSSVDYAPNALGEPTRAGSFASAVSYYPNGAIARFTYGNGIVHTLAQNLRGLPEVSNDAGVLKDRYSYDESANVRAIDDQQESISNRAMGYDNLDRLTITTSPATFGTVSNSYDALDNITKVVVTQGPTARTTIHDIDPVTNRIRTIASGTSAYNLGFGYDSQGNITTRGSQGFVFDQGNRLKSATGKATYAYDGLGHRASTVGTDGVNRVSVYTQGGQLLYLRATSAPLAAGTRYIYLGRHQIAEVKAAGAN